MVVWLTAPAEHLAARAADKDHRPLLDSGDTVELFRRQAAIRDPLVRPLASLVIDVSRMSEWEAADAIASAVERG
jgi:shikimate kinase